MYSYQSFIRGRKGNLKKVINYESQREVYCECRQNYLDKDKRIINESNESNNLRISNIIQNNNGKGGKIRYGNTYLITQVPPLVDILGSIEGQPGGSFAPLRNRF